MNPFVDLLKTLSEEGRKQLVQEADKRNPIRRWLNSIYEAGKKKLYGSPNQGHETLEECVQYCEGFWGDIARMGWQQDIWIEGDRFHYVIHHPDNPATWIKGKIVQTRVGIGAWQKIA